MKLFRRTAVMLLSFSVAQNAIAQNDSSARVGITVKRDSLATQPVGAQPDSAGSTTRNVVKGALIGTGIGAAVGVIVTFVMANVGREHADHSEDGIAYLVFGGVGAVLGLLIGIAAGAEHR